MSVKVLIDFAVLLSVLCLSAHEVIAEVQTFYLGKNDTGIPKVEIVRSEPALNQTNNEGINSGTNIKVKLNETEEVEFEIKPNTISREQFLRFRKFLNRKGIVIKSEEGKSDWEISDVSDEQTKKKTAGTGGREGLNINLIDENIKKKYPEKLSEVTAEDILPLLPQNLSSFLPQIYQLKNEKCQKQAEYFLRELHNLTAWAVQMFDASTKIPEGILHGSSHNLGNFDECINVNVNLANGINEDEILKGQYCLAKVSLSGFQKKKDETDESYYPLHSAWGTLKIPKTRREFRKDVIYWSFCVPSACTNEDVEEFLNSIVETLSIRGLQLKFQVPFDMCQTKRDNSIDNYDIALGIVVSMFVIVIAMATIYDIMIVQRSAQESRSLKVNIALCFSAYTNFLKLSHYTPSVHNLDSIFGIKAITMILILMGHASAFLIGGPSMNSNFKEEAVLKVENALLLNNPLLVDTFLMIGAFLLCRLLLAELEKKKFVNPLIVYVARIIRLTPAYAVVIAIYCTWFYKFDSGPLWEARVGLERERCRKSWWANVLYINNYVNNEYLCMFQSWYLAVDTHFFFLAPGIIYPLYKWPLIGEIILFAATIISVIIPFVVTFLHHLDPVLMMYASEITDLSANPMYKFTYIKTHMRGMSYTIGLFLGYAIHKIQTSGYKVPKTVLWCGWIIGAFSSVSAMFSVSVFYYRPYDAFESATYAALHRVGWCTGIAWIIFACVTNNAGKLHKFFSAGVWVPISRLSYCAYLANGLVELHTIGTLRHTRYLTNLEVVGCFFLVAWVTLTLPTAAKETMSHITLTYGLALVFSILFEAPILGIESLLLKKASNPNTKKHVESSSMSVESQSSIDTSVTNSTA